MPQKIEIPYEILSKLYIIDKKTIEEIAEILNCSPSKIGTSLKKYEIPRWKHTRLIDLSGQKFYNWTVIKRDESKGSKHDAYWICECLCGNRISSVAHHLKNTNPRCQKCENDKYEHMIGTKIGRWTILERLENNIGISWKCQCECGYKKKIFASILGGFNKCKNCIGMSGYMEISGVYLNKIKWGAEVRKLEYSISNKYIWDLYIRQNRKCALTHIDISFEPSYSHKASKQNASLDRIDSSKGYIENNVQWIHKVVNIMKMSLSQTDYINICNIVANNHKTEINQNDLSIRLNQLYNTGKINSKLQSKDFYK